MNIRSTYSRETGYSKHEEPAHGRRLDADWHKLGAEERGCDAGK
jgi:hypothetical protein